MTFLFYNKYVLRAFILFLILTAGLWLTHSHMGLDSNSFNAVYHAMMTCDDIAAGSTSFGGAIQKSFGQAQAPFIPSLFILLWKWLGGSWGLYYAVAIMFHAATFAVLYFVMLWAIPDPFAWFLVFCAALHPIYVYKYFGLMGLLTPAYLFFAGALAFFGFYIQLKKKWYYIVSVFFYALSLLFLDQLIFFPIVLIGYLFLFDFEKRVNKSWLFFFIAGLHVILRLFFSGSLSLCSQLDITIISNFFGMQQYSLVFSLFIFALFFLILISFILHEKEKRKKISFYLFAFFIFLLSSLYVAIPFFCLILYELLAFLLRLIFIKNDYYPLCVGFIAVAVFSCIYTTKQLSSREGYTYARDVALCRLARFIKTDQEAIVLLGLLDKYNNQSDLMQHGMKSALRLLLHHKTLKVYEIIQSAIQVKNSSDSYCKIIPVQGGYRLISQDAKNIAIPCWDSWRQGVAVPFYLGTVIPHHIDREALCTDMTIVFNKAVLRSVKLLHFVVWHPEIWDFEELDKEHLKV